MSVNDKVIIRQFNAEKNSVDVDNNNKTLRERFVNPSHNNRCWPSKKKKAVFLLEKQKEIIFKLVLLPFRENDDHCID